MKNVSLILLLLFSFGQKTYSQTVIIGKQVWMTENLNVDKFNNGDPIPEAKTEKEWITAGENKQPAWCYYENDKTKGAKYGKLYNWYAVNDPRGLAPIGYHIPTNSEWTQLQDFLGGENSAGGKMKTISEWEAPNTDATNSSGFSGLPGGLCFIDGTFFGLGQSGGWWSSSEFDAAFGWYATVNSEDGKLIVDGNDKESGYSIRCLKDKLSYTNNSSTGNIQNVTIGVQVWMTKNLNVDKFRNGDTIPEAKTNEEWKKARENKQPAWCYYDNNPDNGPLFGKLYNWYAVNDPRGLAPVGYHVPSDAEWTTLLNFLGGEDVAGIKLKNKIGWDEDGNGTNSSGFSGLPCGYRNGEGKFDEAGHIANWWSSTEMDILVAWYRTVFFYDSSVYRFDNGHKHDGYSVRCLQD